MSRVRILPIAADEVNEARRWYLQRSPELSDRFNSAARALSEDLAHWPSAHSLFPLPEAYSGTEVRSAPVKGFPYRLIYQVTPATIWVLAFAHTSREPLYWVDRVL